MLRRRISVNSAPLSTLLQRQAEVKEKMRERFMDAEYVEKFIDVLLRSGWNSLDIDSAVRQDQNAYRPEVQAFLLHNEHVLDQLRLNQAAYTHFADRSHDPNYAIRHPGQFELLMRRVTPGDLMLLKAAHHCSARLGDYDRPSEHVEDYWAIIWQSLLAQMPEIHNIDVFKTMGWEPGLAVATVLEYALLTYEASTGKPLTFKDLSKTFMDPKKPFYVGLRAVYERTRTADGFVNQWTIFAADTGWESCWMAASVILCYAIDNDARLTMLGEMRMKKDETFHSKFIRFLKRGKIPNFTFERENGNQETQDNT